MLMTDTELLAEMRSRGMSQRGLDVIFRFPVLEGVDPYDRRLLQLKAVQAATQWNALDAILSDELEAL